MADVKVTYTPNLHLIKGSDLTPSASYNLDQIDLMAGMLGITFDTTTLLRIRGKTDITVEPNSAALGGSGTGGSLNLGTTTHSIFVNLLSQTPLRWYDADSSNYVAFEAPNTVPSNVTWKLPSADGTANQVLKTDGSGNLSWGLGYTPLTANRAVITDGSGLLTVSVTTATEIGYVSGVTSAIQTQINSKVPLTRTISTTSPLTGGGDLSADRTLAMPQATTSVNGYLTSTDWTTFNSKVSPSRTISTTAPLTGGGDLSANRTLSIPQATGSVDGYLSAVDWTAFNAKQGPGSYITALTGDVTASGPGAAAATITAGAVTNAKVASGIDAAKLGAGTVSNTEFGYLDGVTSALQPQIDSKPPATRAINTTSPLTGGGNLTADRTLSIPQATGSVDGYLLAADWTTFNSKQPAGHYPTTPGSTTDSAVALFNGTTGAALKDSQLISDGSNLSLGTGLAAAYTLDVHADIVDYVQYIKNESAGAGAKGLFIDLASTDEAQITMRDGGGMIVDLRLPVAGSPTPWTWTLPPNSGTSGYVLSTNGSGVTTWIPLPGSGTTFAADWLNSDGTTKSVAHGLGTRDVIVQVYNNDGSSWGTVLVGDDRTDANTVTLTAAMAPAVAYRVLVSAVF